MFTQIKHVASNRLLVAVLTTFVVLSVAHSFVTRLKYGPDEPAHFIYIRSIALDFALPELSHVETKHEFHTATHEAHQPPLYYFLMAVPYALLAFLGVSHENIWRVLRLLNVPLGVVYVVAVYSLTLEFFGDRRRAATAAGFVALIPTSAYTFGVINNENLISPLFTFSLIMILRYFKTGVISPRSAVATGVFIGLSVLSKAQGLVLVPFLLIAALALCRRGMYADWRMVVIDSALVLGTAFIVGGWWYVRNYIVLGVLIPQTLHKPAFPAGLADVIAYPGECLAAALAATCTTFGYFWTPFWLMRPFVPFIGYLYVVFAGSALLLAGFIRRIRRLNGSDRRALALLLAVPLMVYLLWLRHALFVDIGANMQGRLFLSTAGVAGIIWLLGIEGLAKTENVASWLVKSTFAALVAANAMVLACSSILYYGAL